jgi:glycolate dehydrogenase FAD-binding subunit
MKPRDPAVLTREFAAVVAPDRVRPPNGRETRAATLIIEPENAEQAAEIVRKCEADAIRLAPLGAARTLAQIRPAPVEVGVSLARISAVVAYEPDDMTVVAGAGLTLGALNRILASHGQRLPVDPAHPDLTTLGALVAAAKSGPLRLSEGTVRDLLIGVRFVGHGGRLVHGGGRVVKNVAGYDLMKVMTGSFGTLGIITETTFKVRPIPENYSLAIASYAALADAFAAARKAGESAPLIHLEVLSPALSAHFARAGHFAVLAAFGGIRAEVEYQRARMIESLGAAGEIRSGVEAAGAYETLRDLEFPDAILAAHLAVPPAELARCLERCNAEFRAHAGCGVAQLFLSGARASGDLRKVLAHWREVARSARGNLRVLAVDPDARAGLPMFDDPSPPALKLMRQLKAAFDPIGIFNPGCFVGGL